MRDIVLCFFTKNSALPVRQKTKQCKTPIKISGGRKSIARRRFFLAKTFFKLLRLIVIAFRKRMRTYFSAKQ